MNSLMRLAVVTTSLMAAGAMASAPASAQVHVGVGFGLPGVSVGVGVGASAPAEYYGPGYYPPGPCDAYNSYYAGDCGYAVYNGPIFLDGIRVGGRHYYRWYDGMPYFWYRGDWHVWNGWERVNFDWDRGEGFGWREGHWDRDWGNAHWHGDRAAFRDDPDRHGDEFHRDNGDHDGDHGEYRSDRDDHHGDRGERRGDGHSDHDDHRGDSDDHGR